MVNFMCRAFKGCMALCALLFTFFNAGAHATENGLTNYPVGVNTALNGLLPAPGQTYFYNYFQYYKAESFRGSNGKEAVPKFSAEVAVDAPRIVHTWNETLGPFNLSSGVIVPIFHVSTTVVGQKDIKNAVGDVIVHPLMFGYSNPSHNLFMFLAPFDMALPTGAYDKDRIANTGQNHLGFLPNWQTTWFPTAKTEISTSMTAEIYTENHDTNYQSGTVLSGELLLGYSVTDKWQIGIQGFYSKQVTDDELDGEKYLDGFRGQSAALGPQVRYTISPGVAVVAKYQHEFAVENRSKGDRFWIQFAFPI